MNIQVDVPDGKKGAWEVSTFEVSEEDARVFNLREAFQTGRFIRPGTYKRLSRNGGLVMSNTPAEIDDHFRFIYRARNRGGDILINGLGLGCALSAILESDKVSSVTVIEISQDVIDLVGPTFAHDQRVTIINADAFTWKPPKGIRYTVVWHDI